VGKSTLATNLPYPGTVEIATLDDPAVRDAAALDPRAFVQRTVGTLVIDEVQLEPSLFRAIKAEIDRDRRPGRFLLTGSSRLLSAPDMADSLVGRVETIELWPFAQSELTGSPSPSPPGTLIDSLVDDPTGLLRASRVRDARSLRADVIERICTGGFPEVVRRTPRRRAPWFNSYVTTGVERAILQVSDIQRATEIPRLLRLCAARTAQELNVSNLANEFGLPSRTVGTYIAHLASAFLVHLVPAWSSNLSSKVIRRPKLMMVDTGLAAHLVGVGPTSLDTTHAPFGALLETFVATELMKQLTWSTHRPRLFHFRDRNGAEVDLVLEYPDGRVVGIEVKATSTPRADDFRGLRWLADKLGSRFGYGLLLTSAPEATPFGARLAALPVDALWRE